MTSPFTIEHEQFRKTVRRFCEEELAPHAAEWERDELFPNWVFKRAGELGILGAPNEDAHLVVVHLAELVQVQARDDAQ